MKKLYLSLAMVILLISISSCGISNTKMSNTKKFENEVSYDEFMIAYHSYYDDNIIFDLTEYLDFEYEYKYLKEAEDILEFGKNSIEDKETVSKYLNIILDADNNIRKRVDEEYTVYEGDDYKYSTEGSETIFYQEDLVNNQMNIIHKENKYYYIDEIKIDTSLQQMRGLLALEMEQLFTRNVLIYPEGQYYHDDNVFTYRKYKKTIDSEFELINQIIFEDDGLKLFIYKKDIDTEDGIDTEVLKEEYTINLKNVKIDRIDLEKYTKVYN